MKKKAIIKFKRCILWMLLWTTLLACSEKKDVIREHGLIGMSSLEINNSKFLSIVSDYIELNEADGKPKVYRLVIEQGNGDILFKLSYIRNYSEVLNHLPTAYFKREDRIILINSGLETISKPDSIFIGSLEELILPSLKDDVTPDNNGSVSAPVTYYAEVWDIKSHNKSDSLTVNKKGRAPYVKYLSEEEQIKFEPPKK